MVLAAGWESNQFWIWNRKQRPIREGGSTNWGGEYPVTEVKRAWLDMAQGSARVTSQQLCVEPLGLHPESSREGALGNIPKGGAWPKVGAWGAVSGWAGLGWEREAALALLRKQEISKLTTWNVLLVSWLDS